MPYLFLRSHRTFTSAFAVNAALLGSVIFLGGLTKIHGQSAVSGEVVVTATPTPTPHDNWAEKRDHLMGEVSGTQITVTKKATVIKLDKQPPIQNNNLNEEFVKAPGLLVTEQNTPGQFNFSYRGLGNPQESEFVLVLQDGLPLMSEWIGFPTLYYIPQPQSVSQIQLIRGGSSLLYGPEPAPAVNFVMKRPVPGSPWNTYVEQAGGPYGYYSSHAAVQEAMGPIEFRLDGTYVTSEGQRDNSEYNLWQSNLYLGWRPDENQLTAVDFHASRFSGDEPGRLTIAQFEDDQNQSTTPYNHSWVDRYTVVLRHEHHFGDGWFGEIKGWYTHQDIDARSAANLNPTVANPSGFPNNTVFAYEEFNNGGVDLRLRKDWGDGTALKGSSLTFGGLVYHGDAPFERYTLTNANFGPNFLYAPRGSRAETVTAFGTAPTLDQDRTADYQALFFEDLVRWGKFHLVGSFRLDHETVEVDSHAAPWLSPPLNPASPLIGANSVDADHWIPMWGVGIGNDFGDRNETYFSASSGWRPTRFFDIAGTSRTTEPGHEPDPFESLDFELGVHGSPGKGFWYDIGLFWMEFQNRTESQNISNTEVIIVNSGSTRHRGLEGEISYDLLAMFQHAPEPVAQDTSKDGKSTVDSKSAKVPGTLATDYKPFRLIVFSNAQFLDAEFTESDITITPTSHQTLVGNEPAFAPDFLWKGGISFQRDHCFNIQLSAVYSSDQFWADNNQPSVNAQGVVLIPAKIPAYKALNLSGEFYITKNVRVFGGISNLTDEKYYSRVFFNGTIEPAPRINGFFGASVEF